MRTLQIGTLAILLLMGLFSAVNAEYLIYLKGGHYIVADDCSFSAPQGVGERAEGGAELPFVENCTHGKPEKGQIFWRTINGNVGEVNADDVYAIFGAKSLPPIKSSDTTMPLEDYLITNRDESFVNAKAVEERGAEVYGLKRDDLAQVNRRGIVEIAPERLAKARSGEGLCPGEPKDFSVSLIEVVDGRLLGVITNLSKEPWRPLIEVEVRVKGRFLGKFEVGDRNVLRPDESISMDSSADSRFLNELKQLKDADSGVRLCYRKIKTAAESSAK